MRYILSLFLLFSLSGCFINLNPSRMLKTPRNFKYTQFDDSLTNSIGYRLAPNDILEFRILSNDGFKLVEFSSVGNVLGGGGGGGGAAGGASGSIPYLIEYDGFAKLPILGKTYLSGLTVRQAENLLQEKYSNYYIKPFVLLRVMNKRVIIFPGTYSGASVVTLTNNNTRLVEILAMVGGISSTGRSRKIKIIRGYYTNDPKIYLIDLSTIKGLKASSMVLQANDIVYVEPRSQFATRAVTEAGPWLSLISTLTIIYTLFKK